METAPSHRQLVRKRTLRKQYISKILLIVIIIALVTGVIQGCLVYNEISSDLERQASIIGQSVEQGINETDLASREIEHQIDMKLESYTRQVAERLDGKSADTVTNEELIQAKNDLGLAGISLFKDKGDDLVGVKATDPEEIGFSWKSVGPKAYEPFAAFVRDQDPGVEGQVNYIGKNLFITGITQSGSHDNKPVFYKYAYYHKPQTDYMISTYIEASEVYDFTAKVGPDSWIQNVLSQNGSVIEIAVLNPRSYADPKLETDLYAPLKRVANGEYRFVSKKDEELLISMAKEVKNTTYIEKVNGKALYKIFLPLGKEQVIYIALDYKQLSAPLYRFAYIVIISGLLSLVILFMFSARFFSEIYRSIQQIIAQIKRLELGDFTAQSQVSDKGELQDLSESANKMAATLNHVLTDTNKQASKLQRLSVTLETDANQSVDKVFTMSMETTASARETVEEIFFFLDRLEEYLKSEPEHAPARELLANVDRMRQVVQDRTNTTTEMTLTLSDLLKSLHEQSRELSEIADLLMQRLVHFKL
jgi:methyl-accepting chemotaxis protein